MCFPNDMQYFQTTDTNNDICEAFIQQFEVEEFDRMNAEELRDCITRYCKRFKEELEVNY